jgi:lipopolysaccharide transport protein LptA
MNHDSKIGIHNNGHSPFHVGMVRNSRPPGGKLQMNKRWIFAALAVFCACATAARAQEATATPEPSRSPAKKDTTGLGAFQKDRPKNAKTVITCKDETTFDNETRIATFVGSVFVKDVQFNLYCDTLTVYLDKDRKAIDHAEADGHVVIVQENVDNGKPVKSIGRASHAVFVPATGEATLTGMPQLQQGINNNVATDPKTYMILKRDGQLHIEGPSASTLVESSDINK